jgi:uncharacterized membrane protein YidH (DUF202 family)
MAHDQNQELETPEALEKKRLKEEKDADKEIITLERFRIATEKMQISWMRKSLMISFLGLTLYKIFEEETGGKGFGFGLLRAQEIGLLMLLLGFVSLILATKQHLKTVAKVKRQYERFEKMPYSVSLLLTYALLFLMFLILLATILRYLR